ncbi:GtrA family protein [Phenylobacterium sp.]|uniref:GtrA family protein n=1 Tax=Phenylobacterium sp. TaxID=1871053 RepID=UPI002731AA76|nr:GtrA family protein [Phenylobacterium sp.]MDP1617891.1 GtrA family protein [Phenylobacterium sp.]MDP1988622.1 GtrA family protein [Phenylobacterium sp.]
MLRFGLVAAAGLVVDLAVASALAAGAGLPLPLAAACGFCAGAAFNYVVNLRWTFAAARPSGGVRRIAAYGLTLAATLLTRVVMVALLEPLAGEGALAALGVLIAATGVSFVVNYGLSKRFVFVPSQDRT